MHLRVINNQTKSMQKWNVTLKYLTSSSRATERNVEVFYSTAMNEKFSGCREQFRVMWEFRDPAY